MNGLIDLMDACNLLDRAEGLISGLIRARGQTHTFRIPQNQGASGATVEETLSRLGGRIWGRRVTGEHVIFSCSRKQAVWCEYVLLRAGIVPDGPPVEPRNAEWARQHVGEEIPAWAERGGRR